MNIGSIPGDGGYMQTFSCSQGTFHYGRIEFTTDAVRQYVHDEVFVEYRSSDTEPPISQINWFQFLQLALNLAYLVFECWHEDCQEALLYGPRGGLHCLEKYQYPEKEK